MIINVDKKESWSVKFLANKIQDINGTLEKDKELF